MIFLKKVFLSHITCVAITKGLINRRCAVSNKNGDGLTTLTNLVIDFYEYYLI
jgi:hypothetical protein